MYWGGQKDKECKKLQKERTERHKETQALSQHDWLCPGRNMWGCFHLEYIFTLIWALWHFVNDSEAWVLPDGPPSAWSTETVQPPPRQAGHNSSSTSRCLHWFSQQAKRQTVFICMEVQMSQRWCERLKQTARGFLFQEFLSVSWTTQVFKHQHSFQKAAKVFYLNYSFAFFWACLLKDSSLNKVN